MTKNVSFILCFCLATSLTLFKTSASDSVSVRAVSPKVSQEMLETNPLQAARALKGTWPALLEHLSESEIASILTAQRNTIVAKANEAYCTEEPEPASTSLESTKADIRVLFDAALCTVLRQHPSPKYSGAVLADVMLFHDVRVIQYLIAAGANVNGRNRRGETALHIAAARGAHKIVSVLLKAGADVTLLDAMGGDSTALHWAALYYRRKALKEPLDLHAIESALGTEGREVFGKMEEMEADTDTDPIATVTLLMHAGINHHAKNLWGRTALEELESFDPVVPLSAEKAAEITTKMLPYLDEEKILYDTLKALIESNAASAAKA